MQEEINSEIQNVDDLMQRSPMRSTHCRAS